MDSESSESSEDGTPKTILVEVDVHVSINRMKLKNIRKRKWERETLTKPDQIINLDEEERNKKANSRRKEETATESYQHHRYNTRGASKNKIYSDQRNYGYFETYEHLFSSTQIGKNDSPVAAMYVPGVGALTKKDIAIDLAVAKKYFTEVAVGDEYNCRGAENLVADEYINNLWADDEDNTNIANITSEDICIDSIIAEECNLRRRNNNLITDDNITSSSRAQQEKVQDIGGIDKSSKVTKRTNLRSSKQKTTVDLTKFFKPNRKVVANLESDENSIKPTADNLTGSAKYKKGEDHDQQSTLRKNHTTTSNEDIPGVVSSKDSPHSVSSEDDQNSVRQPKLAKKRTQRKVRKSIKKQKSVIKKRIVNSRRSSSDENPSDEMDELCERELVTNTQLEEITTDSNPSTSKPSSKVTKRTNLRSSKHKTTVHLTKFLKVVANLESDENSSMPTAANLTGSAKYKTIADFAKEQKTLKGAGNLQSDKNIKSTNLKIAGHHKAVGNTKVLKSGNCFSDTTRNPTIKNVTKARKSIGRKVKNVETNFSGLKSIINRTSSRYNLRALNRNRVSAVLESRIDEMVVFKSLRKRPSHISTQSKQSKPGSRSSAIKSNEGRRIDQSKSTQILNKQAAVSSEVRTEVSSEEVQDQQSTLRKNHTTTSNEDIPRVVSRKDSLNSESSEDDQNSVRQPELTKKHTQRKVRKSTKKQKSVIRKRIGISSSSSVENSSGEMDELCERELVRNSPKQLRKMHTPTSEDLLGVLSSTESLNSVSSEDNENRAQHPKLTKTRPQRKVIVRKAISANMPTNKPKLTRIKLVAYSSTSDENRSDEIYELCEKELTTNEQLGQSTSGSNSCTTKTCKDIVDQSILNQKLDNQVAASREDGTEVVSKDQDIVKQPNLKLGNPRDDIDELCENEVKLKLKAKAIRSPLKRFRPSINRSNIMTRSLQTTLTANNTFPNKNDDKNEAFDKLKENMSSYSTYSLIEPSKPPQENIHKKIDSMFEGRFYNWQENSSETRSDHSTLDGHLFESSWQTIEQSFQNTFNSRINKKTKQLKTSMTSTPTRSRKKSPAKKNPTAKGKATTSRKPTTKLNLKETSTMAHKISSSSESLPDLIIENIPAKTQINILQDIIIPSTNSNEAVANQNNSKNKSIKKDLNRNHLKINVYPTPNLDIIEEVSPNVDGIFNKQLVCEGGSNKVADSESISESYDNQIIWEEIGSTRARKI